MLIQEKNRFKQIEKLSTILRCIFVRWTMIVGDNHWKPNVSQLSIGNRLKKILVTKSNNINNKMKKWNKLVKEKEAKQSKRENQKSFKSLPL